MKDLDKQERKNKMANTIEFYTINCATECLTTVALDIQRRAKENPDIKYILLIKSSVFGDTLYRILPDGVTYIL
jgi:hypothetical protein